MVHEPLTATNLDDLETWQNITQARHVLKKFSSKGDLADVLISGNKTFHISTRERHINEESAATDEQDPFRNGMFAPVRLVDATDDVEQIASNPNLMSESDMDELVKGNVKALQKRLGEVRNPVVLERLLEVAHGADATVGKVEAIKARLAEVSPSLYSEVQGL